MSANEIGVCKIDPTGIISGWRIIAMHSRHTLTLFIFSSGYVKRIGHGLTLGRFSNFTVVIVPSVVAVLKSNSEVGNIQARIYHLFAVVRVGWRCLYERVFL